MTESTTAELINLIKRSPGSARNDLRIARVLDRQQTAIEAQAQAHETLSQLCADYRERVREVERGREVQAELIEALQKDVATLREHGRQSAKPAQPAAAQASLDELGQRFEAYWADCGTGDESAKHEARLAWRFSALSAVVGERERIARWLETDSVFGDRSGPIYAKRLRESAP